jgi:hypothetical protein
MLNAIVVMVLLSAAQPVFGEQSIVAPPTAARVGSLRPAHSDPHGKLFAPQKTVPQPAIESQRAVKTRVICGMTIIPVEPKHDPLMVVEPKTDGIDYKIRALDPPLCNPRR